MRLKIITPMEDVFVTFTREDTLGYLKKQFKHEMTWEVCEETIPPTPMIGDVKKGRVPRR